MESPRHIGREHRHFALGEIQVVGCRVDHDQRERHERVDRTVGKPRRHLLDELLHVLPQYPRYDLRICSSLFTTADSPDITMVPVLST